MRISLVEIGSNAVRHYIATTKSKHFVIEAKTRYPIRLGSEVFNSSKISSSSIFELECIFSKIFHINKSKKIKKNICIATSALREARNTKLIVDKIKKNTGIHIQVINGDTEAELVQISAMANGLNIQQTSLLIDMGGGSTEFIICKKENMLSTKSFPIGTLKYLNLKQKDLELKISQDIHLIKDFLIKSLSGNTLKHIYALGGNARRIGKLNKYLAYTPSQEVVTSKNLKKIIQKVSKYSFLDRIKFLGLRKDRADVIIPASLFFLEVLKVLDIKKIKCPDISIADSIFYLSLPSTKRKIKGLRLK